MKVICYAVAPLEDIYIENWAKKNDVEVKILREDLNEETVHLAEGFDGISSEGIEPVTEAISYSTSWFRQSRFRSCKKTWY